MICRGSCGRALNGRMHPVCGKCHGTKISAIRPVSMATARMSEEGYSARLRLWIQRAKCIEPFTPEVAEFVDRLAGEFLGGEL